MANLKVEPSAAVIGDLVGSRRAPERRAVHETLRASLAELNDVFDPVVPLRITVGDEYQGCFATVGEACRATLRLRLALLPVVDVRHGIGWGTTSVLQEEPRVEDGPAWWAARKAIEQVEDQAGRAALRLVRTAYCRTEGTAGPEEAAVNAALLCRDQLVGMLSERSAMLLRGLVEGRTQRELAEAEGVSASAVSQRVRRDGLGIVLRSDELLEEVR
jgi:hypothetical protein